MRYNFSITIKSRDPFFPKENWDANEGYYSNYIRFCNSETQAFKDNYTSCMNYSILKERALHIIKTVMGEWHGKSTQDWLKTAYEAIDNTPIDSDDVIYILDCEPADGSMGKAYAATFK